MTCDGLSQPVLISRCRKQGCLLSGLLFNIVMDTVLRAITSVQHNHSVLAYADDLMHIADEPSTLQRNLAVLAEFIWNSGLMLNPRKCFSVHLGTETREFKDTILSVHGVQIPTLLDGTLKISLESPLVSKFVETLIP